MEEKFIGDASAENGVKPESASDPKKSENGNESSEHHRSHSHHSGSSHHHGHSGSSHHHSSSHRSHHSSSHHGHGRSRRKKLSDGIRKWWKSLKNNQNRVSIICAFALALVMLVSITFDLMDIFASGSKSNDGENGNTAITSDMLNAELLNGDGILVTEAVRRYLSLDLLGGSNKNTIVSDFVYGLERYDVQNPVSLKLTTDGDVAFLYKIEYADNPQFLNASIDYLNATSGTYIFEHLCASTRYYYKITAYTSSGALTAIGQFDTADYPRLLTIDGIHNVRDIGNWKTDSGKRIRQGLLIRGTELDGAVESGGGYQITNDGLYDLLNVFGIKFDMDLRSKADTPFAIDALGSRVEHRFYDSPQYADIFKEDEKVKIANIFRDLANPQNYPMYLHCTYGCDRTGTVCYLLEALLGVSRGDCIKDYGLSNLSIESILAVEEGLKSYGGNSLKEQAENYLIDCGITMSEIATIRNIFLGE